MSFDLKTEDKKGHDQGIASKRTPESTPLCSGILRKSLPHRIK